MVRNSQVVGASGPLIRYMLRMTDAGQAILMTTADFIARLLRQDTAPTRAVPANTDIV
jgi:hypothetical protein